MTVCVWGATMDPLSSMSPSTPHQMMSDKQFKSQLWPGVVAHTFSPSTREAEPGGFLSLRPAWSTKWVPGQPGLHRETLSWKAIHTHTHTQTQTQNAICPDTFFSSYLRKVPFMFQNLDILGLPMSHTRASFHRTWWGFHGILWHQNLSHCSYNPMYLHAWVPGKKFSQL